MALEHLSNNIRRLAQEKGKTLRALSLEIGKVDHYLSTMLSQGRCMSVDSFLRLADALGVSYNELGGKPDKVRSDIAHHLNDIAKELSELASGIVSFNEDGSEGHITSITHEGITK